VLPIPNGLKLVLPYGYKLVRPGLSCIILKLVPKGPYGLKLVLPVP